jgi:isopentenyl-diphosphate delta-isomerase
MAHRWISLSALRSEVVRTPEQFTPWLKIYLADHQSQIFNGAT